MSEDYWSAEYKAAMVNELNEVRELLADCQHGNDKLREEAAAQRKRANFLTRRVQALERLIESLTPGGSEFAGDPEACAAWVRARLSSTGKLAAERNALREQAEELANALKPIYDDIVHPNFPRVTFAEYRTGALLGDLAVEKARVALAKWEEEQPGYAETQYQAHVDL